MTGDANKITRDVAQAIYDTTQSAGYLNGEFEGCAGAVPDRFGFGNDIALPEGISVEDMRSAGLFLAKEGYLDIDRLNILREAPQWKVEPISPGARRSLP